MKGLSRVQIKEDNDLRQLIAAGDETAWREFLGRAMPQVYSMCMRRWPNRSLAEELTQRTVFDAVRGRSSYDPDRGNPEQWIAGIARNNLALEARRRATRAGHDGDIRACFKDLATCELPDELLEKQETADLVRQALEKIDPREHKVLKLKYIEDLSAREIAERIQMTEKAVHSLLYRARNALRDILCQINPLLKGDKR